MTFYQWRRNFAQAATARNIPMLRIVCSTQYWQLSRWDRARVWWMFKVQLPWMGLIERLTGRVK